MPDLFGAVEAFPSPVARLFFGHRPTDHLGESARESPAPEVDLVVLHRSYLVVMDQRPVFGELSVLSPYGHLGHY